MGFKVERNIFLSQCFATEEQGKCWRAFWCQKYFENRKKVIRKVRQIRKKCKKCNFVVNNQTLCRSCLNKEIEQKRPSVWVFSVITCCQFSRLFNYVFLLIFLHYQIWRFCANISENVSPNTLIITSPQDFFPSANSRIFANFCKYFFRTKLMQFSTRKSRVCRQQKLQLWRRLQFC